jgi:hypothetical protein
LRSENLTFHLLLASILKECKKLKNLDSNVAFIDYGTPDIAFEYFKMHYNLAISF